jgi:hypothetical protein
MVEKGRKVPAGNEVSELSIGKTKDKFFNPN